MMRNWELGIGKSGRHDRRLIGPGLCPPKSGKEPWWVKGLLILIPQNFPISAIYIHRYCPSQNDYRTYWWVMASPSHSLCNSPIDLIMPWPLVLFKFRADVSEEHKATFVRELKKLKSLPSVQDNRLIVGGPSITDPIERSKGFEFALVSYHRDRAALAEYQASKEHH